MEEQSNEALWYVVHTYSGYENKVATDLQTMVENRRLQDLICDIKVPTEMVPEIKDGKERMVEHKLFPGYVLVKMVMNDDTWYVVRNTRGCTGFVGPASKPVPLTAEEVEKMGVEKAAPLTVDFNVGDTVQITAGPLEGFMGLVEGIDTLHKAHKAFQGAGGDLHGIADVEIDGQRSRLLDAHLLHFLSGQGDRLRGRADEACAAARIAHDIPGIVVHDHLDQNVAGEQLVLHHTLLAVLDLGDHLGRDLDVTDQILQAAVLHHGL